MDDLNQVKKIKVEQANLLLDIAGDILRTILMFLSFTDIVNVLSICKQLKQFEMDNLCFVKKIIFDKILSYIFPMIDKEEKFSDLKINFNIPRKIQAIEDDFLNNHEHERQRCIQLMNEKTKKYGIWNIPWFCRAMINYRREYLNGLFWVEDKKEIHLFDYIQDRLDIAIEKYTNPGYYRSSSKNKNQKPRDILYQWKDYLLNEPIPDEKKTIPDFGWDPDSGSEPEKISIMNAGIFPNFYIYGEEWFSCYDINMLDIAIWSKNINEIDNLFENSNIHNISFICKCAMKQYDTDINYCQEILDKLKWYTFKVFSKGEIVDWIFPLIILCKKYLETGDKFIFDYIIFCNDFMHRQCNQLTYVQKYILKPWDNQINDKRGLEQIKREKELALLFLPCQGKKIYKQMKNETFHKKIGIFKRPDPDYILQ